MAIIKDSPQKATKKKLRAAYNRGYLAAKKSAAGKFSPAAEKKQEQKVEVVLNYGDLSISIRTDK